MNSLPSMNRITDLALNYTREQLKNMPATGYATPTEVTLAAMLQARITANSVASRPTPPPIAAQLLQPQPAPQQMPPQQMPSQQMPPQQVASAGIDQLSPGAAAPTPQAMAGGGIVAFDEGGHVPGYAGETDGSLVQADDSSWYGPALGNLFSEWNPPPKQATPEQLAAYERAKVLAQLKEKYGRQGSLMESGLPGSSVTPKQYALGKKISAFLETPNAKTLGIQDLQKLDADPAGFLNSVAAAPAAPPVAAPPVAAPPVAAPPVAAPPVAAPPVAAPPVAAPAAKPLPPSLTSGIGATTSVRSSAPVGLGSLETDRKSLEETQKQLREAVYPEYKGTEREAELAKRDSGLADMHNFNKAKALMDAGASMANFRGPYLAGLTAAGKAGFESYAAGQDKMQAVQDAISKERAALADAREQGKMKQADEHVKNLGTLGTLQAHLYTADATLRGQDVMAQKYGAATDRAGIQARSEFFKTAADNAKDMLIKLRSDQAKAPLASEKAAFNDQIAYYEKMARQYMSLWANAEGIKMPEAPPPIPAGNQTSMVGQRAAPKQQPT